MEMRSRQKGQAKLAINSLEESRLVLDVQSPYSRTRPPDASILIPISPSDSRDVQEQASDTPSIVARVTCDPKSDHCMIKNAQRRGRTSSEDVWLKDLQRDGDVTEVMSRHSYSHSIAKI